MATFCGQLKGSRDTTSTKTGTKNSGIKASVQSWDGSITTALYYNDKGELIVNLSTSNNSAMGGDTIFNGTLQELKDKLS